MDDLISRRAALDTLNGGFTITGRENAETIRNYINGVNKRLRELPSAERHGQWKDIPFTARWICSNCDYISEFASFKYCPDCGARMEESE